MTLGRGYYPTPGRDPDRNRTAFAEPFEPEDLVPPELAALMASAKERQILVRDAIRALSRAETQSEIDKANRQDLKAIADAMRSGRDEPGSPNLDALREKIEQLRRRRDAAKILLAEDLGKITRYVDEHFGELISQAEERSAMAQAEMLAALQAADEAQRRLATARSHLVYLWGHPSRAYRPETRMNPMQDAFDILSTYAERDLIAEMLERGHNLPERLKARQEHTSGVGVPP